MDNSGVAYGSAWAGRLEDEALLQGKGRFTANFGGDALVARFARSNVAHARIISLDLSAARSMNGVEAVFAMSDLSAVLPKLPLALDTVKNLDGSTTPVPARPALASDRIRFVGEAYALVIAHTEAQADDAVEAISTKFDELAAISEINHDSFQYPSIHDACPENLGFDWIGGDEAATLDAMAKASRVARARIRIPRILGAPLEPFACVASYEEGNGLWTLIAPSQGVHAIRRELADGYLDVPHDRIHVITPDVGGAFGIRIHALPEQAAILAAAKLVGQSIVWRGARSESALCEPHARDFLIDAELALDDAGQFLGLRAEGVCNLGAYTHPGARATPTASLLFGLHGAYRMPTHSLRMRGRYTNTTPTGPFRGAGQPEGTYALERLIDQAARDLGINPVDLRRRNALCLGDQAHKSATGHVIEGCDALAALDHASAWLDRQHAVADGRLAGKGLALYLKVNGMGRQEKARISVDPDCGTITAYIGSQTNGQGHTTTFAALTAERLSLPIAQISIVQGDSRQISFGTGTGASSALGTTGTGISRSCKDLLAKARALAARHLNVPPGQLDYASGSFTIAGSNNFITLRELAALSEDGLIGESEVGVSLTYTVGCHACVVGIDPETGEVQVLHYAAFDDLGPLLQPRIAAGQIQGGVAQGIGQALHEYFQYDRDAAQPTTTTFLDYQLPRAADLPHLGGFMLENPAYGTELGVRGAGEAGAMASMATVVNAAANAIGGSICLEPPLTPNRVWRYLEAQGI